MRLCEVANFHYDDHDVKVRKGLYIPYDIHVNFVKVHLK